MTAGMMAGGLAGSAGSARSTGLASSVGEAMTTSSRRENAMRRRIVFFLSGDEQLSAARIRRR